MRRGISSLSFSGPLEKKIAAAADAGFAGLEIFREDLVQFDGTPADVKRLAADLGIDILSLQSLRDFEAAPDAARDWNFRRARRFLDLAVELGAPLLVVCANTRADTLADPARAAADLAALADEAATRGLKIGYEALSVSRVVKTYRAAWDIVRAANRPNLGLIVGAVHTLVAGADFSALADVPAERIFLVHMADAPSMQMDPRLLNRHFRVFPGQGDQRIGELHARLKSIGYRGPISLEIFNDQVRAMPAANVASDGIRSFELFEEAGNAAGGTAAPGAPVIEDVGFLEIACSGDDAARLKTVLIALGFTPTHQHDTMKVTLFQQGTIDIVVNEDDASLAHSFYLFHGLSVFALALRVANMAAMLERVERCHGGVIERHGGPIGPKIPAIRGIGGSFVYLLDKDANAYYADDFRPLGSGMPNGKGLKLLDHFSQAVPLQEHLSSILYYRALFGFEARDERDLIDPHGTVRNRNLRSTNGNICMSLNASISPNSSTQRLLNQVIGAGFQHFAFLCDDIFAFAATMERDLVLEIPANYYDDLRLRFDLDDNVLEKMRAANILYDEDDDGSYFQLYTRDINGLFFEVVQRHGYRGFGATNAPVRMAAQARDFETLRELAR